MCTRLPARPHRVATALALVLCPALALAQDAVPVPPIEVTTGADAPSARPVADRVDDPAVLDAPGGPARAAAPLAAARVRESGGAGQPATLGVRGVDAQGTLVTLEGVTLSSPFLGGTDLSLLSLLPVERATLARGGRSALHGADAVGGVLELGLPSPLAGPATDLSLAVGSFGVARLRATQSAGGGRVAGLGSAGLLVAGNAFPYTDANGRSRVRTHNGVLALEGLVKLEAVPAPSHRVSIVVEGFADDRDVAGLEQFPSATAFQKDSRFLASAAWTGPRPFGSAGTSSVRLRVVRLGLAYDDRSPPMGAAVSTALSSWSFGADGAVEGRVLPWLRVSAGADAGGVAGTVRRARGASYDAWRASVAAMAGTVFGFEGGWWRVAATVRGAWDRGSGFRVLPRGEAELAPLPWLRLFADAALAYRLPTFEELHFDAGYVQGNPDLDPESAVTWDAGLAFGPPDGGPGPLRWSVRAAWFENRVDNLILFLPRSAFALRAANSGSALLRGVETSASLRWGPVGVRGAYTFLVARFGRSGLAMPHRPRHAGNVEVSLEHGPLRATVRASGQSAFYLDRFESLSEEARWFLDARLEFSPIPALSLALDATNLLDRRGAVDALQQPLPGRAFLGTLRVSL